MSGTTRRWFCSGAAALAAGCGLRRGWAQTTAVLPSSARPDVAAIDHDRILAAAQKALAESPVPLTSLPCPRSPGSAQDYYSEDAADGSDKEAFTAHRDAVFGLGVRVSALAAAWVLTAEERYAAQAAKHLRAWFVDPATSMIPKLEFGAVAIAPEGGESKTKAGGRPEGIVETLPLVEVAQAVPFLASSEALTDEDLTAIHAWFAAYLRWLTETQTSGARLAALARDRKDHHGTSWMLQASAYTRLGGMGGATAAESGAMTELRHRFHTVTIRAQMLSDGTFPRELTTANPYRNSLFNLDMMAAICELLSTRFDSVWEYELQDGPGMRSAIAFHFPFIQDRGKWPYRADAKHFTELPGRRAALLLAGRAYSRPEYAAAWKTLPVDTAGLDADVLRTMPVCQPLLWVRQPTRRG